MKRFVVRAAWMILALAAVDSVWSQSQLEALEDFLFDLPDVRFGPTLNPEGFESAWELQVRQPLDHNNPEAGFFYQRVYVSHLDVARPTVLVTEGYNRGRNYASEIAQAIGANQVVVEHRYYGKSLPDSMDYQYLNIAQAAADLHRIRELLGSWYTAPWVASGISKGGQTTIYYRYFYPEDVAASVPYVAPINLALEDVRIYSFLDRVGSKQCRKHIEEIQRRILTEYDESFLRLKWHAKGEGLRFEYLTLEEAFEFAVLEYPFSFWQWGANCDDIPASDAPLDDVLDHFLEVSGLAFFSDDGMINYASHYYQCAAEFGYYGYETEEFEGLLRALPMSPHPSAIFTPEHMPVKYDGGMLAKQVYDWVQASGDAMIHINGALDTWSATAMPPNPKRDALYFFLDDQSHGTARIANMTDGEREEVKKALVRWLGMEITGDLNR